MNPMLMQFLTTIFRYFIVSASTFLVSKGIIKGEDMAEYATAAAVGLATVIWALWSRYKSRLAFLTALEAPMGTTEEEVKDIVKNNTKANQ
jgi:hypothetical protein